jgi:hypothetical protein
VHYVLSSDSHHHQRCMEAKFDFFLLTVSYFIREKRRFFATKSWHLKENEASRELVLPNICWLAKPEISLAAVSILSKSLIYRVCCSLVRLLMVGEPVLPMSMPEGDQSLQVWRCNDSRPATEIGVDGPSLRAFTTKRVVSLDRSVSVDPRQNVERKRKRGMKFPWLRKASI